MKKVRIVLYPPDGSFPSVDKTLAETPGVTRESILYFEWLEGHRANVVYRLSSESRIALTDALDSDDKIIDYEVIESADGQLDLFVHEKWESELVKNMFTDQDKILYNTPFRWVDDGSGLEVELVGSSEELSEMVDESSFPIEFSVESVVTFSPGTSHRLEDLTERQREAVGVAYEMGYYDQPRKASCEDVAEKLDCTAAAANKLLRRSETKIFSSLLGG